MLSLTVYAGLSIFLFNVHMQYAFSCYNCPMELITPRRYYDFIKQGAPYRTLQEKYDLMRDLESRYIIGKLSPLGFVLILQKNFDINKMRDFAFCNSLHPVDHNIFIMNSIMYRRAGLREK